MKSCCVHINNDRMRNVSSYTLWNWQEMHIFTVDRCVLKSWSWPSSLQTSLISHTLSDRSPPFTTGQLPNLSIHFNGHFPREPGLAGVFWSKEWWRWWWQLDYWSYKSCKVPVKSSPPTNQNPVFFTGRMSFLSPNQQCQSTEGKVNCWMKTGIACTIPLND